MFVHSGLSSGAACLETTNQSDTPLFSTHQTPDPVIIHSGRWSG